MKNKFFTITLYFIFLGLFFFPSFAYGKVSVGIGPEYFLWREYSPTGQPLLEEAGYRYSLRLHWTENRSDGVLFGYHGKLYGGTVIYNGQTLATPPTPVTTDTFYSGFLSEGELIFRLPLESAGNIDGIVRLGWDHWTRNIKNQNNSQLEDYDILFLKLGSAYGQISEKGLWVGGGIKLPFYTFENAYLNTIGFDQNPALHPGRQLSFYLDIGLRLNSKLEFIGYYDSYRFSESPKENVTQNGAPKGVVFQPKSYMDLIGVQAIYHFH